MDNELTFEERESLLEHLEGCPACRELSRAYEVDSFRVRRALRAVRPQKVSFIQRTLALILEHEEPHREVAPADDRPAGAGSWRQLVRYAAVAAAAAAAAILLYQSLAPLTAEVHRLREQVRRNEDRILEIGGPREGHRTEPASAAGTIDPVAERSSGRTGASAPIASIGSGPSDPETLPESTVPDSQPAADHADPLSSAVQSSMQELLEALRREEFERAVSLAKQIGGWVLEISSFSAELASHLTNILDRSDLGVEDRVALTTMLAKIRSDASADYFRGQLLGSVDSMENVSLRRVLVEGLALNADSLPDGRMMLARLLHGEHEDYQVRSHAVRGLLRIAHEADAELFEDLKLLAGPTSSMDPRLRQHIIQLLASNPLTPGVVDFLRDVALQTREHDDRALAIDSLGTLPSEQARIALDQLSSDRRVPPDLRDRARRTAERLPQILPPGLLQRPAPR